MRGWISSAGFLGGDDHPFVQYLSPFSLVTIMQLERKSWHMASADSQLLLKEMSRQAR